MEKKDYLDVISEFLVNEFTFQNDVADFIACQFALESDFGCSNLAKLQHNYCGMRVPFLRISTCKNFQSKHSEFACYETLYDCIVDYVLCLQYHCPLRKELDNLNLFKGFIKFYCPDRDYVSRIETIYNQFFNN